MLKSEQSDGTVIAQAPGPAPEDGEFWYNALTHHDHHDISVASMHVHLDYARCLEVSILKGKTDEVRHFADHIKAERHVTHGTLAVLPL